MKFIGPQDVGKCERFLMLPYDIFESDLPPLAKLLYAHLLNLTTLSAKNGLCDERGVYVFCTIETACRILDCGHDKATAMFRCLENAGLIYRKKRQTAPYIYLLEPQTSEKQTSEIQTSKIQTSDQPQSVCEIPAVSHLENRSSACEISATIYTETNYTDFSNTEESKKETVIPRFPSYVSDKNEEFLWGRAKCRIGYFGRKASGEDEAQLFKETEAEYWYLKENNK